MKKILILLTLLSTVCVAGCGRNTMNSSGTSSMTAIVETETASVSTTGEKDMNDTNRALIAQILGIKEDSRNIRFILRSLDSIHVGMIRNVSRDEENGSTVLNFEAEDGTKYRMYLSPSGNPEAVQNLDTGTWLIKSEQ